MASAARQTSRIAGFKERSAEAR